MSAAVTHKKDFRYLSMGSSVIELELIENFQQFPWKLNEIVCESQMSWTRAPQAHIYKGIYTTSTSHLYKDAEIHSSVHARIQSEYSMGWVTK